VNKFFCGRVLLLHIYSIEHKQNLYLLRMHLCRKKYICTILYSYFCLLVCISGLGLLDLPACHSGCVFCMTVCMFLAFLCLTYLCLHAPVSLSFFLSSAGMPLCLSDCLCSRLSFAYLPVCLPACLPACLPVCLPACLSASLSACLLVCLPSGISSFLPLL
jgi:hypothetical protein